KRQCRRSRAEDRGSRRQSRGEWERGSVQCESGGPKRPTSNADRSTSKGERMGLVTSTPTWRRSIPDRKEGRKECKCLISREELMQVVDFSRYLRNRLCKCLIFS